MRFFIYARKPGGFKFLPIDRLFNQVLKKKNAKLFDLNEAHYVSGILKQQGHDVKFFKTPNARKQHYTSILPRASEC